MSRLQVRDVHRLLERLLCRATPPVDAVDDIEARRKALIDRALRAGDVDAAASCYADVCALRDGMPPAWAGELLRELPAEEWARGRFPGVAAAPSEPTGAAPSSPEVSSPSRLRVMSSHLIRAAASYTHSDTMDAMSALGLLDPKFVDDCIRGYACERCASRQPRAPCEHGGAGGLRVVSGVGLGRDWSGRLERRLGEDGAPRVGPPTHLAPSAASPPSPPSPGCPRRPWPGSDQPASLAARPTPTGWSSCPTSSWPT